MTADRDDRDRVQNSVATTDEDLPDIERMRRSRPPLPQPARGVVVAIDTFADWFGQALAWLVIALVVVVVMEAIRRYAFNAPSIWAYDVSYMLYGAIFMLGGAVTLRYGGHIRTDLFYKDWSPRRKATIDLAFYLLLFFPGLVFFLLTGLEQTLRSYAITERAAASFWRPILWPYRAVIPLTAFLLMVQGVSEVIKAWYQFKTGRDVS